MDYLKSHLSEKELAKVPLARILLHKNNMSMKNYVELYMISEFEEIFKKMFA